MGRLSTFILTLYDINFVLTVADMIIYIRFLPVNNDYTNKSRDKFLPSSVRRFIGLGPLTRYSPEELRDPSSRRSTLPDYANQN